MEYDKKAKEVQEGQETKNGKEKEFGEIQDIQTNTRSEPRAEFSDPELALIEMMELFVLLYDETLDYSI